MLIVNHRKSKLEHFVVSMSQTAYHPGIKRGHHITGVIFPLIGDFGGAGYTVKKLVRNNINRAPFTHFKKNLCTLSKLGPCFWYLAKDLPFVIFITANRFNVHFIKINPNLFEKNQCRNEIKR